MRWIFPGESRRCVRFVGCCLSPFEFDFWNLMSLVSAIDFVRTICQSCAAFTRILELPQLRILRLVESVKSPLNSSFVSDSDVSSAGQLFIRATLVSLSVEIGRRISLRQHIFFCVITGRIPYSGKYSRKIAHLFRGRVSYKYALNVPSWNTVYAVKLSSNMLVLECSVSCIANFKVENKLSGLRLQRQFLCSIGTFHLVFGAWFFSNLAILNWFMDVGLPSCTFLFTLTSK